MAEEGTKFDIAVIGGGPAGMMAAGVAAESGEEVILIEKNKQLGKKLLLTGNGRCNITNAEFNLRDLAKNYNNGEFLFRAFSIFGPKETIKFFEKIGVKTKIENSKRVFPFSDDAEDVLEVLKRYLEKNKVNVSYGSEIVDLVHKGKKIDKIILKGPKGQYEIVAKKYILCTGGKSRSSTGSDGLGYKLAEKLGHAIVEPMPALSPIEVENEWVKNLQGVGLKDTNVSAFQNGKKQFSEEGEILFTHFGISGPAVLDISGKVGELLGKGEVKICFDLFPLLNHEKLRKGLDEVLNKYPKQTIKNILSDFLPERIAEILLDITGVNKDKIGSSMSKIEKEITVKIFKKLEVIAKDVYSFDQSLVTRGGISLKEIDHKTMKSKIIDNLFFAGEIIDVDGKSGGFNLQLCWSTGYLAGESASGQK